MALAAHEAEEALRGMLGQQNWDDGDVGRAPRSGDSAIDFVDGVGDIVSGKLIETVIYPSIARAGAERGLLVLCRGTELQIAAEAINTRLRCRCVTTR